jgi:hypothetical protein
VEIARPRAAAKGGPIISGQLIEGSTATIGQRASYPLVAISILNWNGWQDSLECLESVRRLDYPNYLTVVVDNGSSDDSLDRIRAWAKETLPDQTAFVQYRREMALAGGDPNSEVRLDAAKPPNRFVLIRNEDNLGFPGGNNVSIHYALTRKQAADFVFLLNNDASVSPQCLNVLVAAALQANAGIAEAAIYGEGALAPDAPFQPAPWQVKLEKLFGNKLGPYISEDNFCDVIVARGAAVLLWSKLLRKLFLCKKEYLHEAFFLYRDDDGISVRATELGFRCVRAHNANVWHKGGKSCGGLYNPVAYYYGTRNGILLSKEMARAGKPTLFCLEIPLAVARLAKCLAHRRWRAARAIVQGLIDGYRGVAGKWKWHDRENMAHRRVPFVSIARERTE